MTDPRSDPTGAQLDVAAATFDLLSVPARLHLVVILAKGEFDVQTLADRTGQLLPATSQQLAKLRAAGVVAARRDGRRQMYRVDDPHILAVVDQMLSHIGPDGTLTPSLPGQPRARNPRFTATSAL